MYYLKKDLTSIHKLKDMGRNMTGRRQPVTKYGFICLILGLFLINFLNAYSASSGLQDWRNASQIYCNNAIDDTISSQPNNGSDFYFHLPSGVLEHFDSSIFVSKYVPQVGKTACIIHFDEIYNAFGTGYYKIQYGTFGNTNYRLDSFEIVAPAAGGVFFNYLPNNQYDYCDYDGAFSLFNADSSNVSPATGQFYVDGAAAIGNVFNPSTAGTGTYQIAYMVSVGGCTEWAEDTLPLSVWDPPDASLDPLDTVCEGSSPVDLVLYNPSPPIGLFSGTGVSGNYFDPVVTGIGSFNITWTGQQSYPTTTCYDSHTEQIVVDASVVVSFTGLGAKYCDVDAQDTLIGSPTNSNGTFTGAGITNNGDGTAYFDPGAAGLGYHRIIYTYDGPNICANADTQYVQVGTLIEIISNETPYCENEASDVIRGRLTASPSTPVDSFMTIAGLTNTLPGQALFDPSTAGAGTYTIRIYYTDADGCLNTISESAVVTSTPFVEITNLDTSYCLSGDTAYVKGNYATGTFSGDINPFGPGTGMLVPGDLGVGGPYSITYTYTDVNGCTNSVTEETKIFGDPVAKISGNATICYGDTTNITVLFTAGQQPFDFSYQSSRTLATYSYTGFANDTFTRGHFPVDTTTFSLLTVTDANGCSTTGTGSAKVNVLPKASILTNPDDIFTCEGKNDWMQITATGINCTYQWQKDGLDIPGEEESFILFSGIAGADEGAYKCVVNSDCGPQVESDTAQLVLYENTSIIDHPDDDLLCEGEVALLTMEAMVAIPKFQWMLDGQPISDTGAYSFLISGDSSTTTLVINPTTTAYGGDYSCQVIGLCGTLTSDAATLTVDTTIQFIKELSDLEACPGDDVQFIMSAIGTNKTYRWEKNGVTIPGEIDPSLGLSNINAGDEGEYRCWVKSPCGDSLSTVAKLTVNKNITLTSNPSDATRCEGDNVNFVVTTIGDSINTTYQWIKNDTTILTDGGNISGSTDHNLWIFNLTPADKGTYKCRIVGKCDTIISNTATLVVDTNVVVVTQPTSKSGCEGSSVSFYTHATGGTALTYRWQKDGVYIAGANTKTYTIPSLATTDSGSYRCIIKNACGDSALSNTVALTIDKNISFVSGPTDKLVCEGDNIAFTLQVTPTFGVPISYQWKLNSNDLLDTGNVSNSNQATLDLSNVTSDYWGVYSCTATGPCNTVSDNAVLQINEPAVITQQPVNADICAGDGHLFDISTSGDVTGLYQWFKNGTLLPGQTSEDLFINNATSGDSGTYFCVAYGDCRNDTSNIALLQVREALSITANPPGAQSACEGSQVSFQVSTLPSTSIYYQWLQNGNPLQDTGNVSGSDSYNLILNPVNESDENFYACMLWDVCEDTITSVSSFLTVNEGISITKHPQSKTACEGNGVSFTMSSSGNGVTRQWFKNGVAIPGEIFPTLSIAAVTASDSGSYYCLVTNLCDTIPTLAAKLTVNYKPFIATQPTNKTSCIGGSTTFMIDVPDSISVTYQWYKGLGAIVPGGRITVDATGNLSIDNLVTTDAGNYRCLVMNNCDTARSNIVSLTMSNSITIVNQPTDHATCSGDTAYLRVTVTGDNPSYQWQKNGVDIPGATSDLYALEPAFTTDSGVYRCLITGTCSVSPRISANATVVVDSAIILLNSLASKNACSGQDIGFLITHTGTNAQYQWSKDGVDLVDGSGVLGTTDDMLTLFSVDNSDAGVYSVAVTNACGYKQSAAVLSVKTTPSFTLHPQNVVECAGLNTSLNIETSSKTGVTYQWYRYGSALAGDTNSTLIIDPLSMADSGLYRCDAYYTCNGVKDTLTGNSATITVLDSIRITSQTLSPLTECKGDNVTMQVLGTFNDSVKYQWYKLPWKTLSNIPGKISGAHSNSLSINDLTDSDGGTYYCRLIGCQTKTSDFISLQLFDTTAITQHPLDQTVVSGSDATFNVTAVGESLSYQWYKDGVALADGGVVSGSLTSQLDLTGVTTADEGNYHCVVSGLCDMDLSFRTSLPGNLIIIDSSIIDIQPKDKVRCEDESVTFSVVVDNPSAHTYQWYKGTTPLTTTARITGVTSSVLSINPVILSDAGYYVCEIDDTVERTRTAILVVNANTDITTHPISDTICEGNNHIFLVEADGYQLTYNWYKQGVTSPIAGFTGDSLVINPVLKADEGAYYVVVDGVCGTDSVKSFTANLNVIQAPVISSGFASDTVCEGISKTLSVATSGDALNYRWTLNGSAISDTGSYNGSATSDLNIVTTPEGYGGYYRCEVYNSCSFTTKSAQIIVIPDPEIINQPVNDTVCEGSNTYFIVNLQYTIDTISYKWYHNGVPMVNDGVHIIGADTNYLEIFDVVSTDAGTYECRITNTCNPVLVSNPAVLTVNGNTYISQSPVNDTLCEGEQALFTITAGPAGLITYQWYKELTPLTSGGRIQGATSAQLTIDVVTPSDAGFYRCVVTGPCGATLQSTQAYLTINKEIVPVTQPLSQTLCEGERAIFQFDDVEGNNLTYQWTKNNIPLVDDGIHIIGATDSLLYVEDVVLFDSGSYVCEVRGECDTGVVRSDPALLCINKVTLYTGQPKSDTICEGQQISFSIATNHTNLTYQWYQEGIPLTDNINVTGSQGPLLNIISATTAYEGFYWCEVQGGCDLLPITSTSAELMVDVTTEITGSIIGGGNRCVGDDAEFFINTKGSSLSFQWYKGDISNPVANGGNISGADTNRLKISNLILADAGDYFCIVTGIGKCVNQAISNTARLTIADSVNITLQPVGDIVCEGTSTVSFEVNATGATSFQWMKGSLALMDTANYVGSKTNELYINGATTNNEGTYYCIISGTCKPDKGSDGASLIVRELLNITDNPDDVKICEGKLAAFLVNVDNDDSLSYVWTKDGVPLIEDTVHIFGVNTPILRVYDALGSDAGSYQVNISGSCNSDTRSAALTVDPYPADAGTIFGPDTVCQGAEGLIFSVAYIPNANHVWTVPDGINIVSGQGTNQIIVNIGESVLGGDIKVQGVNDCGEGTISPTKTLTVNPVPNAYAGENVNLCGSATTLNANSLSPGISGVWTILKGYALIDDDTLYNTGISSINQGDNVFQWTVSQNGCSAIDTVTISNNQQIMEAGEHEIICNHIYYFNATPPAYGTGEWSIVEGSGINISQNNPNSIVTGLSKGRNVFRWSVQYNGCLSWDTVQIINGLPSDADAGPDQVIMADNTFLNANDPTIGTGEWSLLNGAASFADQSLYNTEVTGLMVGKNIFKWTITNSATGCSTSDTVNVINNTADTTEAGPNQIICSSTARMDASDPYPGIGQWYVLRGSATFEDNTSQTTLVTNLARGENVLIWGVNLNGYTYDSVKIVNNSPTPANAGTNQEICVDAIILNGSQPLDGTGQWSVVGGAGKFEDASLYNTSVSGLTYGENRFRWTISKGSCESWSEVTITNSTPTTALAGADQTTCKDTVLLQPNTPAIGTGQWSVLSGAANFNGNYASGFATDDNYLLWTITNSNCTSVDTIIVTNNKPTTANAGTNQSLCYDSVLMTASQPVVGTGTWTVISGSGNIVDNIDPNTRIRNLGAGINIFKWLITYNGCQSSDEVTINYDYVEANAGADQVICTDVTILEGNNPGSNTGVWTIIGGASGGTIVEPSQPNSQVTSLDRGANVFRWTLTKNQCVSYDEVTITNNMPSTSFAGEDQYLCTDATTLNANPVTVGTGAWSRISGAGSFTDSLDSRSPVSDLGLGANTFRWTVSNNGCTSVDEVKIYNNLPINVYAGLDQAHCADTAQLYANQPTLGTGQWSVMQGSASFDDPTLFNTKVRNLGRGTNIFLWKVSTSTCSVGDTVQIANNNPTVAATSADQTICVNYAPLNANQAAYGTGVWSLISGEGTIEDNTAFSTNISGLGLGTNIFSWTITNQNCVSSDQITITNNSPTPADAGIDIEVCQDSYDLRANSPLVGTGSWSLVSGYGIIQDTFTFTTNVSQLGFGPNTFRWTTQNGICVTRDEVIVTYNMASVDAGEPQTVYTNYAELKGNNPISGSGAWSLVAGAGTFDDTSDFSTTVRNLGYNENRFSWTITNGICQATDEVIIIYKPMPIANFEVDNAEGCPDFTVNFINSTQNGTTYYWDFGDGSSSTVTNPEAHVYTVPGRYNVLLTAYGPDNKNVTKDTVITVYQAPEADFDYSPDSLYVEQNMRCYNYSENSTSYLWEFGTGDTSVQPSPTYRYAEPGEYIIILWASNLNACTDSVSKTVKVLEDGYVIFPTAFTPSDEGPSDGFYDDGDGSNDVFHPHIKGVSEYHLEIYSRWGILLFESNMVEIGWDGYYKSKLLEKGVYVWKISGKYDSGRPFTEAGTFLLMR